MEIAMVLKDNKKYSELFIILENILFMDQNKKLKIYQEKNMKSKLKIKLKN